MQRLEHAGPIGAGLAFLILVGGLLVGLPALLVVGCAFLVIVASATITNGTYVLKRLAALVPTLFLVTFFVFFLQTQRVTPETVATRVLGPGATAEAVQDFVELNGLDEPMFNRYLDWVSGAVVGDLGTSFINNTDVADQIGKAIPVSLLLMLYAQIIALIISVPAGVYAAYRANQRGDNVTSTVALGLLSVPNFVLALVLVFIFAAKLDLLPAARYQPMSAGLWQHAQHMILPSFALGLGLAASYMRLLRGDMVATLQEGFITTAKAKGVSPARILWGHALRPSMFTLLTVFAVNSAALIGGALITEIIFIVPGMGNLIGTAIVGFDFLVLQGAVVVLAVGFVLLNFLVDLLYTALDPRIRHVRA